MWKEGALKVGGSWFHYWIKVYDEPSQFGIDNGRISKLMLKRKGEVVCNYDRGWDIHPVDEDTEAALQILLYSENN
jgi:hypothetical protein